MYKKTGFKIHLYKNIYPIIVKALRVQPDIREYEHNL